MQDKVTQGKQLARYYEIINWERGLHAQSPNPTKLGARIPALRMKKSSGANKMKKEQPHSLARN